MQGEAFPNQRDGFCFQMTRLIIYLGCQRSRTPWLVEGGRGKLVALGEGKENQQDAPHLATSPSRAGLLNNGPSKQASNRPLTPK